MRKKISVSSKFIAWPCSGGSGEFLSEKAQRRAYEIWGHAAARLSGAADEMARIDAITAMKRCLNQRLMSIESTYNLRLFLRSNNKYLQLLEQIGLIRPLLLKGLMDVRNDIEHKDKRPPQLQRCLELLDVVWYFLRTTDNIVKHRISSIDFESEDGLYNVEVTIQRGRAWKMSIMGWLPTEMISLSPGSLDLAVSAEKIHSKAKFNKRFHRARKKSDVFLNGSLGQLPDKLKFVQLYFTSAQW